jgi:hypothetical protein
LLVVLIVPVLHFCSTSSKPELVVSVSVVGSLLTHQAPVTVISSATQNSKNERPEDLSSLPSNIIYSHARKDRSGAALQDMLMAHAYAWHRNFTYAGACISAEHPAPHVDQVKELLQATGLDSILPFACPDTSGNNGRIVERTIYYKKDTAIWTADWRNDVRSRLRPSFLKVANDKNTIAIHIRRGDVSPCVKDDDTAKRYLPNQYYLRLLDYYAPRTRAGALQQQQSVVVYSQSESFESLSDFSAACSHNCTLRLDTDLLEVWRGLVLTADTLILSKSSFSLVAGLLSSADQVIYTPFWHEPLANWTAVSRELEHETQRDLERMKREDCSPVRKR